MDIFASMLGAVIALATVLERLIELLAKPPLPESFHKYIPYVAATLGLGMAFAFNLDLITPLLAQFDIVPAVAWAGEIVTGLLIGRGSNLIHDLWPEL